MTKRKKTSKEKDMFALLLEASGKQKDDIRTKLLESLNVKELFKDGSIKINHRICRGLECDLCIKACPTKALFWSDGKIRIVEDMCVYCGACVVNCIVDECIKVSRKRVNGKMEHFSKPLEVVVLCRNINSNKRHSRVESVFPNSDAYLKRYSGL